MKPINMIQTDNPPLRGLCRYQSTMPKMYKQIKGQIKGKESIIEHMLSSLRSCTIHQLILNTILSRQLQMYDCEIKGQVGKARYQYQFAGTAADSAAYELESKVSRWGGSHYSRGFPGQWWPLIWLSGWLPMLTWNVWNTQKSRVDKISHSGDITNKAVPGDWTADHFRVGSVVMLPNWGRCSRPVYYSTKRTATTDSLTSLSTDWYKETAYKVTGTQITASRRLPDGDLPAK